MTVRTTSLYAYDEIRKDGTANTQKKAILEYIQGSKGCSRGEVSYYLKLPINCVTGRVNELLKAGLIEEVGKHRTFVSGKLVNTLKAVKQGG